MTKKVVFRKSLVIGIIILFVGASVVPSISGDNIESISISNEFVNFEKADIKGDRDELDQYMIDFFMGVGGVIGNYKDEGSSYYNWSIAQSFKPSKFIQTRIILALSRSTIPPTIFPLKITIRKNLIGENLRCIDIKPEDITEFPNGNWLEYDFDDLIVDVGETYYIVCYTTNSTDNLYIWGGNTNDTYKNGEAHFSLDDGQTWNTFPPDTVADMCFMTFGRDNNRPYSPSIDGPNSGTAGVIYNYDFTADDPDSDNMTYHVEWGDGGVDEGFVESGGAFTLTHSWDAKGDYTIKAKLIDEFGAESDWGELEVTMPRTRAVNTPFLNFLEQHPILYQLLLRFLRL